jgi:hypothetical protein
MVARWVHPLFVVTLLASALPARAGQDAPDAPAIEIGADIAAMRDFYDGGGRPWGPRVTFNLSPETALVMFGESRVSKGRAGPYDWSSRLVGVEIRQAVTQSGPFTFNVVAGGGTSFRRDSRAHVGTGLLPAAVVGVGVGQRIGRHLSLHQELRLVLAGDGSELRAQLGFSVPIGGYRTGGPPESRRFGAATVRTAQHVWITRIDGTEAAGTVRSIDRDGLLIATAAGVELVRASDVRRIERPDGVGDGTKRGTAIGAASAAGLFAILGASCRGDCMSTPGGLIVGAVWGAGLGAAFGAVVDGLHRNRQTVFERVVPAHTVTVVPLIGAGSAGVTTRVEW